MRLTTIRLDAGPSAVPALDAWRRDPQTGALCVLQRVGSGLSNGNDWPWALRTTLHGAVSREFGAVHVLLDAGSVELDEPGAAPPMRCAEGREAVVASILPPPAAWRHADPLAIELGERPPPPLRERFGDDSRVLWLTRRLALLAAAARAEPADDQGLVASLVGEVERSQQRWHALAARCPGRSDAHRASVLARLMRIRAVLDAEPCGRFTVADLAALGNWTASYLARIFRSVFDIAPNAYADHARLRAAMRLLTQSTRSTSEIATLLGFENRSAFSRWFSQLRGVPPTFVRQSLDPASLDPATLVQVDHENDSAA